MGQLCDAGCRVTFDAQSVHVHLNNQPLLTGSRDHTTGLWHLGLTADTSDTVPPVISDTTPSPGEPPLLLQHSYAATHSATPAELVAFAHAALFSPALSTLTKALDRGYLPQCMGLTSQALRKHPPHSVATIKGHLDQTRKNQRSTKTAPPLPALPPPDAEFSDEEADAFPVSDPDNARSHHCYTAIVDAASGQIYSDQTGKFIVASSTGNNYILVVYDYDSNSILVEPMRSRTGPCILAAFTVIHARLVAAGLRPQLQRLDNECSEALKSFLTKEAIKFQLVPPKVHRRTPPNAQSARSKITSWPDYAASTRTSVTFVG
ncbi:hypothetical protein MHU86_12203 [Fragilaria crotonensis]|nr:hypothetical protein MHU86_12203 [Fragilaria crotonensis]